MIFYTLTSGLLFLVLTILALLYIPRTVKLDVDGYGKYEGHLRGFNTFHCYGKLVMENRAVYWGEFKNGLF